MARILAKRATSHWVNFFLLTCVLPSTATTLCEDLPFDEQLLARAIATQKRSYQLLLWISDAIRAGMLPRERVAKHSGGPEAAREWLASSYDFIPSELRPPRDELDEFAAFFSTYLTSSFEVAPFIPPGHSVPLPFVYCNCEFCIRWSQAGGLKARKLFAQDKRRADELMAESVCQAALEWGATLDEAAAKFLVAAPTTRRAAAYLTYGHWLIERLRGNSDGPALLALWRILARDPRGGARRGFELRIEDFQEAEKILRNALFGT